MCQLVSKKRLLIKIVNGQRYPEDNKESNRSPAARDLRYMDVEIETQDGETLVGWFAYQHGDPTAYSTIVFYHENAGNIGYRISFMEWLYYEIGCNFLIIGYRGYGHSTGSPSEKGLMKDGEAIINWALNHEYIDNNDLFVYGRSMGGQVAIYIAEKY